MVLLGINCGLGNSDIGQLRRSHLDLENGWLTFPRPKTALPRRCWLWPETVLALKAWFKIRPEPKDPANDRIVYITKYGSAWHKDGGDNPLSTEMKKLLKSLGLNGERNFYTLRHTYRTIAGNSKDMEATFFTMGHAMPGMARNYVETVNDERLQAVAMVVHRWLFGPTPSVAE